MWVAVVCSRHYNLYNLTQTAVLAPISVEAHCSVHIATAGFYGRRERLYELQHPAIHTPPITLRIVPLDLPGAPSLYLGRARIACTVWDRLHTHPMPTPHHRYYTRSAAHRLFHTRRSELLLCLSHQSRSTITAPALPTGLDNVADSLWLSAPLFLLLDYSRLHYLSNCIQSYITVFIALLLHVTRTNVLLIALSRVVAVAGCPTFGSQSHRLLSLPPLTFALPHH